ncbi:hypothetical protein C2E23DRAFT_861685 [Lenzites betulinus]|nr:hypothetical protein C2E23DRAFT_861685 [Lenzites betulinus]
MEDATGLKDTLVTSRMVETPVTPTARTERGCCQATRTADAQLQARPGHIVELAHDKLVALVTAMEESQRSGSDSIGGSWFGVVGSDSEASKVGRTACITEASASTIENSEYWSEVDSPPSNEVLDKIPGLGPMDIDRESNAPRPPYNSPATSGSRTPQDENVPPLRDMNRTPRAALQQLRPGTPHPQAFPPPTPRIRVNLRDSIPAHLRSYPVTAPPPVLTPMGATAAFPAPLPVNGTGTFGFPVMTSLSFTPVPDGGFPVVALDAPDALFRDLARSRQAAVWSEDPSTTLLATVYNSAYPRPGAVRALTNAMTAAVQAAAEDASLIVVPPETEWAPVGVQRGAPITWVIMRLRPESALRLLSRPVWSSPSVTFFVYPRDLAIPRFLMTLTGFAHSHGILQMIWATFRGDAVLPTIFALARANPSFAAANTEQVVDDILASIEVTIDELSNGNIHARIYMDSPTVSPQRWIEWRNFLRTVPFESNVNTTATAARPIQCAGCHGADHPTGQCPFQDLPGWNAPRAGGPYAHNLLYQGAGGPQGSSAGPSAFEEFVSGRYRGVPGNRATGRGRRGRGGTAGGRGGWSEGPSRLG